MPAEFTCGSVSTLLSCSPACKVALLQKRTCCRNMAACSMTLTSINSIEDRITLASMADANGGKLRLCGQAAKKGGYNWALYTAYSYTFAPKPITFAHDGCNNGNPLLDWSRSDSLWCPGGPTGNCLQCADCIWVCSFMRR